ncbi:leucine-rich repeat domain-containing protein [Tenacibaculum agarivorans]|uniref:leucine-rich repeat domain-containing protein n=1 Tax=Tenacibaculum agarivorans TaxID=1908389 RepID=UPI00094BBEF7|nr:hypothetical protein [Tenacibaculum agarivorans]
MKKLVLILILFLSVSTLVAQYTQIPDPQFEASLSAYDDILGDGQVPTDRIEVITVLDIEDKGISNITGIEDFTALVELYASENSFSTIDVSANTALEILDISDNTNLTSFISTGNSIESYDFRSNAALEELVIVSSEAKYINIKNGNNYTIASGKISIYGNDDLCVAVDDLSYALGNWTDVSSTDVYSENYCRYTAIPDANFENVLSSYDDMTGDGQVPTIRIETVKGLEIDGESIADLTGVEDFRDLVYMNCKGNLLKGINLTNNLKLEAFKGDENEFTTIDFSENELLNFIDLDNNDLESLDLSANTLLEKIDLESNELTSLDLSENTLLREIDLESNKLTSLDLSANTLLKKIDVEDNLISDLVLPTGTTSIEEIVVTKNQLTTLDVSEYTNLEDLEMGENQIETIDLSSNPALDKFLAYKNNLTFVNLKNGTNVSLSLFVTEDNENLTCVLVDNAVYATDKWEYKDDHTNFSDTYCRYTAIPDDNFEAALEALGYDNDTNGDGEVPTALIEVVTSLNVDNKNIADITGIEDFTALTSLVASNNSFTTIDVSGLPKLTLFEAKSCNLSSLNIENGANTNITYFDATNNPNLVCIQVDDSVYSRTNWTNIDATANFSTVCGTLTVAPQVILEGAFQFDGNDDDYLMHNNLSSVLPTTSPYADGLTCDSSLFSLTDEYAVVDWVEIQLRNPDDISEILHRRSALLLRNGDVVDTDGDEDPRFSVWQGNYYVSIAHRNHLTIVSSSTYELRSRPTIGVDFIDPNNILGSNGALADMGDGYFAMPSGDIDENGQVQNIDVNNTVLQIGVAGYNIFDVDMNGQVQNTDVNGILQNVGKGEQF